MTRKGREIPRSTPPEASGDFLSLVGEGLGELGLALEPSALDLLDSFRRLVLAENTAQNLTRLTSERDFALRHVVDSLSCLKTGLFEEEVRMVDIGVGGGCPGIPVKIARPGVRATLVDASAKRTSFLGAVVGRLGLRECRVVTARAEALGRVAGEREAYDVAVTRAVAALAVDLEYAVPLLRVGGRFVALKGPRAAEEREAARSAARELGAVLESELELRLPVAGDRRMIVVFAKTSPTPERYPRRPGIPSKRPLGAGPENGRGWPGDDETLHSRR